MNYKGFIAVPVLMIAPTLLPANMGKSMKPVDPYGSPVVVGHFVNEAGVAHKGDPTNAIAPLTRVYKAIDSYRKRYHKLPELKELLDRKAPEVYRLSVGDLQVPDAKYGDSFNEMDLSHPQFMCLFTEPRPDGTLRPVFTPRGERDVWMACDAYVRHNQYDWINGQKTYRLEGVYVVLWSDGQIEQIPLKNGLWYPQANAGWVMDFPGQTGMPANALTEEQMLAQDPSVTVLK